MPVNDEKREYEARMNKMLDTYSKVLFVTLDNVQSQQVNQVRRDLRGIGELLVGKKTLQKRIITNRADTSASDLNKTLKKKLVDEGILTLNRAMLFTNADVSKVVEVLERYRVQAPARVGAIAPVEVVIPAGNTGLEPTMTNFFQALNIATKISKGTVEIMSDKKVLSVGDKVDNSTAALLAKLKISPFFYQMDIVCLWDRGVVFTKEDLKVTDESIEKALLQGITNITAMSLGAGIPTEASFPHMVTDAFKNLLAVSVETNFEFDEFNGKKLRADIKSGKVAPAAAPAAAAKPAAAAAPKKEEKKEEPEEEDDFGMGGLF
jgi:large subunit ribosomal protein LP0